MNARTSAVVIGALLVSGAQPAYAHRLDEYLQATTISVRKDHVQRQLRLTLGVAVFRVVLAKIDTKANGVISAVEPQAYATRVMRDLALAVDGESLARHVVHMQFASVDELRAGRGEITTDVDADVPHGRADRTLTFENRHQRRISVYLANALVTGDPDVRALAQRRNAEQVTYGLDYVQVGAASAPLSFARWTLAPAWLGAVAIGALAWLWRMLRATPTPHTRR